MNEIPIRACVGDQGDQKAAEDLLPLVYTELRKLAAVRMAHERRTSTLQATELVHEAWLRLAGPEQKGWGDRAHFFAAAAEAMRRILIERARRRSAHKRKARTEPLDFNCIDVAAKIDDELLLLVNDSLEKFSLKDPQAAELVKLRFFVGLGYREAARALGISERTAKRCWTFARAWLHRELSERTREELR